MLKNDEKFRALMQQVLAGSQDAAQELFRDYEPGILKAVRRQLDKRIRSKFDSLDFAQDVWASFFAELPENVVFNTPDDLAKFLIKIAQYKVIDANRHHLKTQKNDVKREQSLDDSRRFDKDDLAAVQPTPSQIVMSEEEWIEFLRKQPLVYRRIFILLREGRSQDEIARELGIHQRTVNRVVGRLAPGTLS